MYMMSCRLKHPCRLDGRLTGIYPVDIIMNTIRPGLRSGRGARRPSFFRMSDSEDPTLLLWIMHVSYMCPKATLCFEIVRLMIGPLRLLAADCSLSSH